MFRHDWAENIEDFLVKLGFKTLEKLIETSETITLKNDIVYPVVTSENKHVFYLIDKTKQ